MVATVPMLRGVWGAALRVESEACYCRLFEGAESERPRYLMRPAPRWLSPRPPSSSCCFPRRQTCSTTGTTRRSPGLLGTGPAGRGWGLSATPSASVPPCLWRGLARRSSRRGGSRVLCWKTCPGRPEPRKHPAGSNSPPRSGCCVRASSSRHRLRPTSSWRPCTGSAPWPGPTPTRSGQRGGTGSSSVVLSPANPGRDAGSTLCATGVAEGRGRAARCRRLARPSRRSRPPFAPPGRRGMDPHRQGDRDGPGPDQDHRLRPSGVGVPGTPFLTAWANSGKSGRATREQALRPMCIRQTRLEPLTWSASGHERTANG